MKTVDEGLTMNQLAELNAEHVGTIAALQAKCAALMAGIDYLRGEIKQHSVSTHFCSRCGEADPSSTDDVCRALTQPLPVADAWRNQMRAEGAHFVANRLLAAWDAGFIEDTAANAADIALMALNTTEFMPDAPEGDFDRSFADGVLKDIAVQLRKEAAK